MAILKKNLATILSGFTKTLKELDDYVDEQHKRQTIAENNIVKLEQLKSEQEYLINDAAGQRVAALNVRAKINELIGGPVSLGQ